MFLVGGTKVLKNLVKTGEMFSYGGGGGGGGVWHSTNFCIRQWNSLLRSTSSGSNCEQIVKIFMKKINTRGIFLD